MAVQPMQPVPDPVQARIVAALRRPGALPGSASSARLVETHISYVLLTGSEAYKIKKAVRLDFLDFSTLEARRFFCEEELRLNRRLAPGIYLAVVALTGDPDRPAVDGDGPVLDYAVKMREFPQQSLLAAAIARNALLPRDVDALSGRICDFHRAAPAAHPTTLHGRADEVLMDALANFHELRPLAETEEERAALAGLEAWTVREHEARRARIEARRIAGRVRECHGDLHLGNIARIDGEIVPFDCIEFSERMRWTDVMSDVAFAAMDLHDHGRPDLAHRFENAYLEASGDYDGVAVLPMFEVYRAMVRAKVSALRAAQLHTGPARRRERLHDLACIRLAGWLSRRHLPAIVVTHGLSGCGKTTTSQVLVEQTGAIRVRTDVERKRLAGLAPRARTQVPLDAGLYSEESTRRTYDHVLALATQLVRDGRAVVVDGAFLARWQRNLFRTRAAELGVPFVVLDFQAGDGTLRARLRERASAKVDASDADLQVLDQQLRAREPLADDERSNAITIDAESRVAEQMALVSLRDLVNRLRA